MCRIADLCRKSVIRHTPVRKAEFLSPPESVGTLQRPSMNPNSWEPARLRATGAGRGAAALHSELDRATGQRVVHAARAARARIPAQSCPITCALTALPYYP